METFHERLVKHLSHLFLGSTVYIKENVTNKMQSDGIRFADMEVAEDGDLSTLVTFDIGELQTTVVLTWEVQGNGKFKLVNIE